MGLISLSSLLGIWQRGFTNPQSQTFLKAQDHIYVIQAVIVCAYVHICKLVFSLTTPFWVFAIYALLFPKLQFRNSTHPPSFGNGQEWPQQPQFSSSLHRHLIRPRVESLLILLLKESLSQCLTLGTRGSTQGARIWRLLDGHLPPCAWRRAQSAERKRKAESRKEQAIRDQVDLTNFASNSFFSFGFPACLLVL